MDFIIINENTEEGFQDLEFDITEYWNEQGYNFIKAYGQFEGKIVGLAIAFQEDIELGINDNLEINEDAFYRDGVLFYSIGSESDQLVDSLSKLYEIKNNSSKMNDIVPFTCFVMDGHPANFKNEMVMFKLFFDAHNERSLYCELYLNIDLPRGILELREKNEEYRVPIVHALTS